MKPSLAHEASQIALEELKHTRQNFNAGTTDGERLKVANACIRLAQCLTRSPSDTASPDSSTTNEDV